MKRIPSLDGIRFVSICLVLGAHLTKTSNIPIEFNHISKYFFDGGLGVMIFFVLSGYLITHLLLNEENSNGNISLSSFYFRRILRIFPVYYAFIFILFILNLYTKIEISTCAFVSSLTFTKNLFCGYWIDGHLWSLSIEEQYYLLWPFFVKYFKGNLRIIICLFFVIICPLARVYFYLNNDTSSLLFSPFSNFDSLFIGSLLAILSENYKQQFVQILKFNTSYFRFIAFIAIYTIWFIKLKLVLGILTIPIGNTIQSIAISYLILSYSKINSGLVYKILNYNFIQLIGKLSFSVYIWQQLFFVSNNFYTPFSLWFLNFPFNVFCIFITAVVSYYLLEKPFLKFRLKYKS